MSVSCVVCGNNNNDNFNLAYYRFPKCPLRRDKWIQLLNLDKDSLKLNSRVCQQHFSKSQIVRVKLIKTAMPKDIRKLTRSDQLQLTGNVCMDMGRHEGLEAPVISVIHNQSTTKGQNLTGEVCLICAQLPDPLEINQPPLCSNYISSFLNPHLWSMFILRLLNFPNEECQNLFVKTFGVNPGDWFRLCGPCFKTMEQAFTLEQKVAKLQKQLEQVKLNAAKKLEESLKLDKINASNKKNNTVFNITKYIRQVFKDIPNKELKKYSVIKTEDEQQGEISNDCPNFVNETSTIECDDDVTSNTTKFEADEVDVPNGGVTISDSDNVGREILTNNTSKKYNRIKIVKGNFAKKLKLTAIKHYRLPESREENPSTNIKNPGISSRSQQSLPIRLTCSLCPAKFIQRRRLQMHLDSHFKYKDTSCPKCNFPCDTPEKLNRHLTLKRCTFQGIGSSLLGLSSASHENHGKCHICGRVYPCEIQFANHIRNHSRCRATTCPLCKFPCTKREKLVNHMKICKFAPSSANSGQVEEFKCDLCGYKTDYPYVFSRHKRVHEQAKFKCESCLLPCLTRGGLDIHMKKMHDTVVKFPAVPDTTCDRSEKDQCQLDKGQNSEELISCHFCPALFPSAWKVYTHVRNVHEKCYHCSKCDITFEHNYDLQTHLLEKHGIKKKIKENETSKFICDKCGMQFAASPAMYSHRKKYHSNISDADKPKTGEDTSTGDGNKASKYERKCPHCEVCCCNMKALKNHMRDGHPELYKHKCDLCPLTYISSGNLKIHMKNVHLKEEVECEKCKSKMRESSMRDHLKFYCKFRSQADINESNRKR